ncbi:hypothetical protein GOP47_0021085 [Adiantum capillus-veneris]|uniref:DUF3511 domain protein n=1 Tax=Adiantum capillus-veneris TaxID=13818 RepID=A0A9D4UAN5_ADICA|nr:hypothetical protein GOP47_0021085 [Adiantum capillus-veneris]
MTVPSHAWPPYTGKVSQGESRGSPKYGMPEAAVGTSSELYAHRRSYSDIYNSSSSPYGSNNSCGGVYAIQPYTPSSHTYRERRTRSWDLSGDPELLRKKRLASYKVYGIEGKVKSTVKRSLHWVKGKYNKLVYGFK